MIKTRYIIIMLLMACGNFAWAQQLVPAWGGGADQEDLSFGFSFSYVGSTFKIVKKPDWRDPFFDTEDNVYVTDSLNTISSKTLPGFAVGFITRYRITDHLEVRTTPALVFADRSLTYTYQNTDEPTEKQVQTTTVDVPFTMKLKSDRLGNLRAYLLGGVKLSAAIGRKKEEENLALTERTVKNVRSYASYEVGFGFDIYFEYFKLSPEVTLSNSFGNMLVPENQPYSSPISKLYLRTLMFSLRFE
ncbi:type IX secretion/gliding motility protein PorT/SprT [Mucilaginibacter segetis]|uniref:Outer membrane beta-barrel protein n=1 Tax=Mucilaginibacter segetis TaxID=2793071 RepID=A0A934PSD2_9SPHI|nr:outer membrane beta-barrel protein [Mucilaginibacter segetis]MBK0378612.1 outer membrane beta-barrel protein [Mucilaginibacter segetis]